MTLNQLSGRWNLLITFAVALCTWIGGFLVLPPLLAQQAPAWSRFGVFAVTLLVGLWLVPIQLYINRTYVKVWFVSAVALWIFSIAGYFIYNRKADDWTFEYVPGKYAVAGAQLTPSALVTKHKLEQEGEGVTNKKLFWEEGGSIVDTWPDTNTRNQRTYVLLGLYLAELFLLASAVVTVVQASYSVTTAASKP